MTHKENLFLIISTIVCIISSNISYSLADSSFKKETNDTVDSIKVDDIILTKDLTYSKYTLKDNYTYNKKSRNFQWDKIKNMLAYISVLQKEPGVYGYVSNYQNRNGIAPVVKKHYTNKYKNIADSLGTERYQSAPLYSLENNKTPVIYARDGSLIKLLSSDTLATIKIKGLTNFEGEWNIPKKYIKTIDDPLTIKHVLVVDVKNQNICLIENIKDNEWVIRSMNPSTTGKSSPPYSRRTPTGIFLVQEKKSKMYYTKDGTNTIQGYAPWASRFTNGAYIHGVPVNNPKGQIREYSPSLGTVPLSHMCVRNASSHAKFIYDQIRALQALVIVID